MPPSIASPGIAAGQVFLKESLVKGLPARVRCIQAAGQTFTLEGRLLTVAALEDEWFEDLGSPEAAIAQLKSGRQPVPDLLTFWQRIPEIEAKHPYHVEWQEIAVLPIDSYEDWWNHRIKSRVRSQIRKAEKDGVVVKEVPFDDDFVRGMTRIFNEAPVRQGRPFWHFGKSFETVKRDFSRHLSRERMIGAYYRGEMIGFIMLGHAGRFGLTGQIISSIAHRDKAPNNALIAKAVEVCAQQKLAHLVYFFWTEDSLAEFKRRCGFECVRVPRYYVPLTWKGRLALKVGAHRGWKAMLPSSVKSVLKQWRGRWYAWRKA